MTESDGPRTLEAVTKTLNVIEALWRNEGAGVTELTDELSLPKSTVHAHLSTLREKGYVVQTDGEYNLSLRFLTYGEYVKHAENLYDTAKEPVRNLADRTGERVYFTTHQNGLGTVLCLGTGDRSFNSDITVGTHMYLHASAAGKAILAHMDSDDVDAIIDEWGLPTFTDETIGTRAALEAELERVRNRGIAENRGEYRPGVYTVGAPVVSPPDTVHGAVAIAGPEQRLLNEWGEEALYDHVRAVANTIEVNLSFG